MKRCSLFCAGWWPFLLFPLLLLLLFALFQKRSVEQDVANNAQLEINKSEQAWAEADTFNRGREVLVTGLAPSEEIQTNLKQQILNGDGVRSVTFLDGIAEPIPLRDPSLTANWVDDKIILNGELNSQDSIDALVNQAQQVYGEGAVVNQLQLSDAVSDLNGLRGLFQNLTGLNNGAEVTVSNNRITLSGEVASQQIKTGTASEIAKIFSGTITNSLTVRAPAPAPEPAPVVVNTQCEERLDELLSATKIEFDTGKSSINAKSNDLITSIAEVARDCPDAEFEVAGHTDSSGSLELNMNLSQARAQAVINRLGQLGINADRFSAQGYGPNQPIGDNSSAEGRAQNRRIEFNLKN